MWTASQTAVPSLKDFEFKTQTFLSLQINVELDVETFLKSLKTFIYTGDLANQDVHRILSYVFKC